MKAESKRLAHMRQNPKADWTIKDVEALCKDYDILFAAPRGGGSHCKIAHSGHAAILTIPYKRPIKPVYIRKLVEFIDSVRLSHE